MRSGIFRSPTQNQPAAVFRVRVRALLAQCTPYLGLIWLDIKPLQ
jgi:hypothetical protein